MAATFTEVTLEDMERFLQRAYRALRPKRGESKGEVYYDLNLSQGNIFIRVWTSIRPRSGVGADKGTDAIRVTMVTKGGRPLVKKGTIVKRTQNWRNSLQDRIEALLEDYESKVEYWRDRQSERDSEPKEQVEKVLDIPAPETRAGDHHEGTFAQLSHGGWGAKILGQGQEGDIATLTPRNGRKLNVRLVQRMWHGRDKFSGKYSELWTFETGGKRHATDSVTGAVVDLTSILVAEKYRTV